MGWSGCFAAVLEASRGRNRSCAAIREGAATLEIETHGVSRAKDLVRMRMPIWYDAMQAPCRQRRACRERGGRPGAWFARPGAGDFRRG